MRPWATSVRASSAAVRVRAGAIGSSGAGPLRTSAGATWSVGKAVTVRTLATGVPKIKTPVAKSVDYRSVTVACVAPDAFLAVRLSR